MKEKVILLFKIPSDHLEICNPVIYDVREIFFDEPELQPNENEKARKNSSYLMSAMYKILCQNFYYRKYML